MSCILTPLLIAAIQDRLDAFNLLLELDAKPMLYEAIDYVIKRRSELRYYYTHLNEDIKDSYLLTLIDHAYNDDLNKTLIRVIHHSFSDQIILSIIRSGANVDIEIMQVAASSRNTSIVQYLLSCGIQPDDYVLNIFVYRSNIDIITQILNCGTKPTDKTLYILNKFSDKRTRAYKQIKQLLIEAMKN